MLLLLQWVLRLLTDYDGIMVPITAQDLNSSTEGTAAWPQSDNATIFFLIWMYFPLLFGVIYSLYCLVAYVIPK